MVPLGSTDPAHPLQQEMVFSGMACALALASQQLQGLLGSLEPGQKGAWGCLGKAQFLEEAGLGLDIGSAP